METIDENTSIGSRGNERKKERSALIVESTYGHTEIKEFNEKIFKDISSEGQILVSIDELYPIITKCVNLIPDFLKGCSSNDLIKKNEKEKEIIKMIINIIKHNLLNDKVKLTGNEKALKRKITKSIQKVVDALKRSNERLEQNTNLENVYYLNEYFCILTETSLKHQTNYLMYVQGIFLLLYKYFLHSNRKFGLFVSFMKKPSIVSYDNEHLDEIVENVKEFHSEVLELYRNVYLLFAKKRKF